VEITWSFSASAAQRPEVLPEEVENPESYVEGATKAISVNIYERNPQARKACLLAYGHRCSVCDFSFEALYGEIGRGFIHVHHLKQLADIGSEYQLNPLTDLRPVCPNCHAMLHRRRPSYSIEELVELLNTAKKAINLTH
jgi:5-methylcytosine-specific restriction enzyme A